MQQKMNFEKVSEILKNKGISFEVISFTDEVIAARTEDTSIDHNYDPKNAIKTLVIKSKDGFKAVILKGNDKIDSTKLESIVGKWTVAGEEVLLNEFGFIPGTVCPLALDLPILIDENVMEMPVWSMGTGEIKKGFNVKKDEVVGVLDFEKVTISVKSNTMKFIVDNSLFDKLPGLKIGVLVARNIDNTKSSGISNNSSKLDENLLQKRIDLWHEALTNVGIDCKLILI